MGKDVWKSGEYANPMFYNQVPHVLSGEVVDKLCNRISGTAINNVKNRGAFYPEQVDLNLMIEYEIILRHRYLKANRLESLFLAGIT